MIHGPGPSLCDACDDDQKVNPKASEPLLMTLCMIGAWAGHAVLSGWQVITAPRLSAFKAWTVNNGVMPLELERG